MAQLQLKYDAHRSTVYFCEIVNVNEEDNRRAPSPEHIPQLSPDDEEHSPPIQSHATIDIVAFDELSSAAMGQLMQARQRLVFADLKACSLNFLHSCCSTESVDVYVFFHLRWYQLNLHMNSM